MARKKISIIYNAPVTLTFSLLCMAIFLLQNTAIPGLVESFFSVGGNASSETPFNRASIIDYVTIFTHIFGHSTWHSVALNSTFILLLGPHIEETYGKAIFVLMITIACFVTGVLCTVFVTSQIFGSQEIVLLLIVLSILSYAKTKTIPLTIILLGVVYINSHIVNATLTGIPEKIVPVIGALCASVFGFIDFVEQRKQKPRKKKQTRNKDPAGQAT